MTALRVQTGFLSQPVAARSKRLRLRTFLGGGRHLIWVRMKGNQNQNTIMKRTASIFTAILIAASLGVSSAQTQSSTATNRNGNYLPSPPGGQLPFLLPSTNRLSLKSKRPLPPRNLSVSPAVVKPLPSVNPILVNPVSPQPMVRLQPLPQPRPLPSVTPEPPGTLSAQPKTTNGDK